MVVGICDIAMALNLQIHIPLKDLFHGMDPPIFLVFLGGVSWDWVNNKLYWIDQGYYKTIKVTDPDTKYQRSLLFETGSIYRVVVDPTTRYAENYIKNSLLYQNQYPLCVGMCGVKPPVQSPTIVT